MNKHLLLSILIIVTIAVSSLKAQISIGPGIVYGNNLQSFGASANAGYDISKKISILGSYSYYFSKVQYSDGSNSNWWMIDLDAAYKFYKMSDKSDLIVLGGLNLIYFKYPSPLMGSYTGFYNRLVGTNIGVGWRLGRSKAGFDPGS